MSLLMLPWERIVDLAKIVLVKYKGRHDNPTREHAWIDRINQSNQSLRRSKFQGDSGIGRRRDLFRLKIEQSV